jgi:predicted nucleic acid-binding protein
MASLILDCSVTISWFMSDEISSISSDILDDVGKNGAIVPTIWQLEVANVLLMSQRNKRITREQRNIALYALNELPINIDQSTSKHAWKETAELAERYSLSLYDACYLELALRSSLPLATFDNKLKQAARSAGASIY